MGQRSVLRPLARDTWGGSLRIRLGFAPDDPTPSWRDCGTRRRVAVRFRHTVHFCFWLSPNRGLLSASILTPLAGHGSSIAFTPRVAPTLVDLMVVSLSPLAPETQAACSTRLPSANVPRSRCFRSSESDEDVRSDRGTPFAARTGRALEGSYIVLHDRVHEAAYSIHVGTVCRAEAHLRIRKTARWRVPSA